MESFEHQRRLEEQTWSEAAYALFWEQGCGKTRPVIRTASRLFGAAEINGLLVVAPPGVESNWVTDEIPAHMPEDVQEQMATMVWRTKSASTRWHKRKFEALLAHLGLAVFCISYHAFMTERGKRAVWAFLQQRRCLYVLDESDDIKTPKAKRTQSVIRSARYAPYRRIMTGTPGSSPMDFYTQMRFLKPAIWREHGMDDYAAFKNHFGVWEEQEIYVRGGKKREVKLLREFRNLPDLSAIISPLSSRLLKEDVLDLPPKLYTKVRFELSAQQRRIYDDLQREMRAELESGTVVEVDMAITRLLRLQQITCGYVPRVDEYGEPVGVEMIGNRNERVEASREWLDRLSHQAIVWARFRPDVDQLMDVLGDRAVRYDGALDDEEAERSKRSFQAGDAQFLVGNPQRGARGLTLVQAKSVLYYSNSFRLRDRLQSEDRAHRPGQDTAVLYGDVVAEDTVDESVLAALRSGYDIAAQLTGDRLREWI